MRTPGFTGLAAATLAATLLVACAETTTRRVPGGGDIASIETSSPGTSGTFGLVDTLDPAVPRYALVVGNGGYDRLVSLPNPGNDAVLIAETLQSLGFDLHGGGALQDLDRPALIAAVEGYGAEMRSRGGIGVVYFAGHGVQVAGTNHLVPVDATVAAEDEIATALVSLDRLFDGLTESGALNVVILDACRNNPFSGEVWAGRGVDVPEILRAASAGLSRVTAPANSLVAFATGPGNVALDGSSNNSPYAAALADALGEPGQRLEDVFINVRQQVAARTGNRQVPWETSSLNQIAILNDTRRPARSTNLTTRWDGTWRVTMICEPLPGDFGTPTFTRASGREFTIQVARGEGKWGYGPPEPGRAKPGDPNHNLYRLSVFSDDKAVIDGQYEYAERPGGPLMLDTDVRFDGTVTGGAITLTGNRGPRQCRIEMRPDN